MIKKLPTISNKKVINARSTNTGNHVVTRRVARLASQPIEKLAKVISHRRVIAGDAAKGTQRVVAEVRKATAVSSRIKKVVARNVSTVKKTSTLRRVTPEELKKVASDIAVARATKLEKISVKKIQEVLRSLPKAIVRYISTTSLAKTINLLRVKIHAKIRYLSSGYRNGLLRVRVLRRILSQRRMLELLLFIEKMSRKLKKYNDFRYGGRISLRGSARKLSPKA